MSNIDSILEKWHTSKNEIIKLQKKCDNYKKQIKKVMDSRDVNTINGTDYTVSRKTIKRETVSKNTLPNDIWKNYCQKSKYESYYINSRK